MADVHAAVGDLLLGAAILFVIAAVIAAMTGGGRWIEWARVTVTTVVGIVATLGVVLFADKPPDDRLHLLYGGMALAVLPFASFFSSEAPPPTRARVFVVAGVVLAGLAWRAAATGT